MSIQAQFFVSCDTIGCFNHFEKIEPFRSYDEAKEAVTREGWEVGELGDPPIYYQAGLCKPHVLCPTCARYRKAAPK